MESKSKRAMKAMTEINEYLQSEDEDGVVLLKIAAVVSEYRCYRDPFENLPKRYDVEPPEDQ